MFINISAESEKSLKSLKSAGFLARIFQDLENNDVLLKMNVIELLSQLVVTKHGYNYMEAEGIMEKIFSNFDDGCDLLDVQLCEPGNKSSRCIKLYAYYTRFVQIITEHFE